MILKLIYEQEGVSDTEAEIVNLLHDDFEWVENGDLVAEIETSKAVVEIMSSRSGFIKNIAKINETIKVGDVIAIIGETIEELKLDETSMENSFEDQEIKQKNISAKALKIAKAANISKDTLEKFSIYTLDDINNYIKNNTTETDVDFDKKFCANFKKVNFSKNKMSEIENLRIAQSNTLPCSCSIVIESFNINSFSKKYDLYFDNIFPVVAEICAKELRSYKNLNGFFLKNKKYLYDDINIGFTIDVDGCTQVPVVHDCDKYCKDEIQELFFELLSASVTNKISPNQLSKPTFIISDLSSVGNCFFHTPLLAPFTSGILGLAIDKKASRLVLTLTYDHQMSSGKEVLLFLEAVRSKLTIESDNI